MGKFEGKVGRGNGCTHLSDLFIFEQGALNQLESGVLVFATSEQIPFEQILELLAFIQFATGDS